MTSPLSGFVMVTFQKTPDTPAAALPLDGQSFYFPPEYLTAIGSGPTSPGAINAATQRVRGYLDASVPTALKWVMTGEFPAAVVAQVDAFPGPDGWTRPASRTLFLAQGRDLVRLYGVPAADVVALFGALYNAARLNRDAQIAAGG